MTAQIGEQSFFAPQTWANDLTTEQGWAPEHPRLLADINGDKKQDVVNGSCPATAPTVKVPLPDGQFVPFVAVQPSLCNGQNDPNISSCQKANQIFFGKATGQALPFIIH